MPTFGRNMNGVVVDVVSADSLDDAIAMFHPQVRAGWTSEMMPLPDGIMSGASFDPANDNFTNPSPRVASLKPINLSGDDFMDFVDEHLGPVRFGAVIGAANQSTTDVIIAVMERYSAAKINNVFRRDKTIGLLNVFVSEGIGDLTSEEVNMVFENWPMG